jgi:hypothetical protein
MRCIFVREGRNLKTDRGIILSAIVHGWLRNKRRSGARSKSRTTSHRKDKLSETTDPVAQTKSYIVIADILLSFAADAAREQALGDFRNLLTEYDRTIRTARDTIVNSEPPAARQGFADFENGLRRQVTTLQDLRKTLSPPDYEPLDQAIQIAISIREEMSFCAAENCRQYIEGHIGYDSRKGNLPSGFARDAWDTEGNRRSGT